MSRDRVELVRAMFGLWNAGDRGRGRSSNLALQFPSAGVFDFACDQVTRVRIYSDVHDALKAVGQ